MSNQRGNQQDPQSSGVQQNPVKDPEDWATGDEPITGPQQSYLSTLAQEAGEQLDLSNMTKADASEHINRLQGQTGRQGGQTRSAGQDDQ